MTDPVGEEPRERGGLRRLDRAAVTLWRLHDLARGAVALAAVVSAAHLFDLDRGAWLLAAAALIAVAAAVLLLPSMRYRAWAFAIREEHVYLRHGVLFRTTSIVPHARIQHVDTRHGPIDRWLGLASLVIFTAGTRGAVVTIPALAAEDAESLRDQLAALSGAGDAV